MMLLGEKPGRQLKALAALLSAPLSLLCLGLDRV